MEEWYSPTQINFTDRAQIEWLVKYLHTALKEDHWPTEPPKKPDGMQEDAQPIGKARIKPRAYFEIPRQFAIEIDARLDICGMDGTLVELQYCLGRTDEQLAKRYRLREEAIRFRIDAALNHMTSYRRRTRYRRTEFLKGEGLE